MLMVETLVQILVEAVVVLAQMLVLAELVAQAVLLFDM
tara:strand:- start:99 stop:212 length:114 start_codon:yes stop_codon:yes gene_type:complete